MDSTNPQDLEQELERLRKEKIEILKQQLILTEAQKYHLNFMQYCWPKGADDPMVVGYHTYKMCKIIDNAIEKFANGESVFLRVKVHQRAGKQMAHDTLVPTPNGFKKHGDLIPGDYVFGNDGLPKKVIAISEELECDRKISFNDRSEFYTHSNHEWVIDRKSSHKKDIRMETKEIEKKLILPNNGRITYNHHVNNTKPIQNEENLLIDPYLLGAWLGDGKSESMVICNPKFDQGHIEEIGRRGLKWGSVWSMDSNGCEYRTILDHMPKLKALNLVNNKHIPEEYFFASEKNRRDLLGGLIDTDGTVDEKGRVTISTSFEQLRDDLVCLIDSLGYVAHWHIDRPRTEENRNDDWKIYSRKEHFKVQFTPNDGVNFGYLKRKWKTQIKSKKPRRAITKIDKIENGPMGRCIQVEGGVYLIGREFIPTHNSDIVSRFLPAHFISLFPDKEVMAVSYSAMKAEDFSRFGRQLVASEKFKHLFPYISLGDRKSARKWDIYVNGQAKQGSVLGSGLMSGLTGGGYHLGILDDYCAGRNDVESEVKRESMWNAFTDDFMTRRAPNSITIVVATQWHEDDIHGRIDKKNNPEHEEYDPEFPKFEDISFPARVEDSWYSSQKDWKEWSKVPMKKKDGTVKMKKKKYLFEERYSEDWYRGMYSGLGAYSASAMMDCNPIPKGGNVLAVDKIQWHDSISEFPLKNLTPMRFWDFGHTAKKKANKDPDWTSGTKLAFRKVGYNRELNTPIVELYVFDYFQTRETAVRRDNAIISIMNLDGPGIKQVIETSLDSIDAFYYLQERVKGVRNLENLNIGAKNKSLRAEPLEPVFETGAVHVVRANWNDQWLDMLRRFDGLGLAHDEAIDNMTAGYTYQVTFGNRRKLKLTIG